MFWENFYNLCKQKNVSPNKIAKELNISSGSVTQWKNGRIPHAPTLKKIANYFGVTTDHLLGQTEIKKPVGIPNELWEELRSDEEKMKLAIWISSLSNKDLKRVKKLLNAADFLDQE